MAISTLEGLISNAMNTVRPGSVFQGIRGVTGLEVDVKWKGEPKVQAVLTGIEDILSTTKTYDNGGATSIVGNFEYSESTTNSNSTELINGVTTTEKVDASVRIFFVNEGYSLQTQQQISTRGTVNQQQVITFRWSDQFQIPPKTRYVVEARYSRGLYVTSFSGVLTVKGSVNVSIEWGISIGGIPIGKLFRESPYSGVTVISDDVVEVNMDCKLSGQIGFDERVIVTQSPFGAESLLATVAALKLSPPTRIAFDSEDSDEYMDCKACNGSGRCRSCGGAGTTACFTCNGTGKLGEISCPNCFGSGQVKCDICDGAGSCKVCNGTGKVPLPR